MSYALQKRALLLFLVVYFLAGTYAVDKYPFFNWALFTKIPNEQKDFTIEIRSFDGTVYDPSLPFSETGFIFDAVGQSPTDYTQTISMLGAALERGDSGTADRARSYLEQVFQGKQVSYAVYKVLYDPVELWRTGAYKTREEIASFDSSYAP